MEIPSVIKELADKYGYNTICYIGKRKGKDAFIIGCVDDSGLPFPTGLPTINPFDGNNNVENIYGEEVLELL